MGRLRALVWYQRIVQVHGQAAASTHHAQTQSYGALYHHQELEHSHCHPHVVAGRNRVRVVAGAGVHMGCRDASRHVVG